jgi:1,3-beta-glucan synthase
MLILFLVLLIAPLIARNQDLKLNMSGILLELMQPLDSNNNDTMTSYTGSGVPKGMEPIASPSSYLTNLN